MDFFGPPPEFPEPPDQPPPPPWMKPDNVMGEPVPIAFVIARTESVALAVQHVTAFPSGFEFRLTLRLREPNQDAWDPMHGLAGMRLRPGQTSPDADDVLRFGIRFSDGRRATTLGPPMFPPDADNVEGPMLMGGAGSAGPFGADSTFWVWPLPPPGALTFGAEWPKQGIALSLHEIDAELIREAASRATELWAAAQPPARGATSYSQTRSAGGGYTPLRPAPRKRHR